MRRREYVRAIGGATGIAITGSLAGCSDSGGGAAEGPFNGAAEGPYAYEIDSGLTNIYARLTISNPPQSWPEDSEYATWTGTKEEGATSSMSLVYKQWEVSAYKPKPSHFGDGGSVTVNALMGKKSDIDPGTSVVFSVSTMEREEFFTLAEITYEGNAESRPVRDPPEWTR